MKRKRQTRQQNFEWRDDEYLPTDLWGQILSRLPVKTLLRLRSVSKEWRSLIDSTYFAAEHLKNFQKNADSSHLLLLEMQRHPDKVTGRRWVVRRSDTFRKSGELLPPHFNYYSVQGYVNGLLLIHHRYGIILCNPSTRRFVHVKYSPNLESARALRLGFDQKSNDFKLLQVSSFPSNSIDMLSLKSYSWKRVSNGYPSGPSAHIEHRDPQVFKDGVIYWLGFDRSVPPRSKQFIQLLSFDVGDELLSFISLPECKENEERVLNMYSSQSLTVLGESLALFDSFKEYGCLWAMEKNGVNVSWTKKYTISLPWSFKFLCAKKNGELLFAKGKVVKFYDPESCEIKDVAKTFQPRHVIYTDTYVESFAPFMSDWIWLPVHQYLPL